MIIYIKERKKEISGISRVFGENDGAVWNGNEPVNAAIDAHLIAMKPTTHIDLDDSIGKFMDLMG